MPNGYSPAHLDALAQHLGFHDYATYSAYQQKQQAMRMNNGINGTGYSTGPQDQPGQGPQPQGNWLQNLLARIPIHPAYLLGKVNDAFTQAGQ